MTDSAVEQIADQFSKTSVDTDGVSFKGKSLKLNSEEDCDEVVEAINSCQDLQYLNLEGNTLGVDASKAISKALESKSMLKRALWKDMFTGRMKEEIPRALEHLGNGLTLAGAQLTELDLSDNAFGPIGVKGLAGLLKSQACYQLQELKLNNNGLGISGGKMLASALLQCHKNSSKEGKALALKLLVVGRNRLENEGAAALAEVFQTLGTLEEISMPQNGIYHKGIKALSDSFKNNPNLRVLDLNDNTITEKGANHIAKALPHLQKLKVLNLGDCLLRTGGATVLAKALTERHGDLEELHLSFNEIKSEGGLAIAKAMTNKNNLKQLNVDGNQFGSAGRTQLRKDLEKNKRILTLGTLSDDDSCDDESDENSEGVSDEDSEDESDHNSEDDKEDVNDDQYKGGKANGVSPVKGNNRISGQLNSSSSENNSSAKNPSSGDLSDFLQDLSIKARASGTLKTFLEVPNLENFLNIEEDQVYQFIDDYEESTLDYFVGVFIPLLAKVASLTGCGNERAEQMSRSLSRTLFNTVFAWAKDKKQMPTINNALFVHFDLIKSEDKNFKINWNAKGCLLALQRAIADGLVPATTRASFKCFMDREIRKNECEEITIDN